MNYRKSLGTVILLLAFCHSLHAQNFDLSLLRSINQHPSAFKDAYCKISSESINLIGIGTPLSLFAAGIFKHDRKLQKDAACMAGAFILSAVVTRSLKGAFHRNRPFVDYKFIYKKGSGGGYSFPSGHTSSAFCTATSITIIFPKWYVAAPAYFWAASVGYARIYQGVHYPTDVLAGALVGAGSSWLAHKGQQWIERKSTKNKKLHPMAYL